ncbi:C-type lectin domain family 2 member A [Anolis carolinensis]|uniref:C-type lectin domain family 2 member A n=1 Tax=Anolis carolinensis TaxID=28377 RepID=UPI002F2B29A3
MASRRNTGDPKGKSPVKKIPAKSFSCPAMSLDDDDSTDSSTCNMEHVPALECQRGPDRTSAGTNITKEDILRMIVAAIGVFLAIVIAFLYLEASYRWHKQQVSGPACPYDWIGYRGRCYFFSTETRNWTSSQNFCLSHGAHLLNFNPIEEKEFVMRYRGKTSFWIGLSRDPGQPWKWTKGETSMLKVIGDGGNCAFLNSEATATSFRCHTELPWICSKVDVFKCENTNGSCSDKNAT